MRSLISSRRKRAERNVLAAPIAAHAALKDAMALAAAALVTIIQPIQNNIKTKGRCLCHESVCTADEVIFDLHIPTSVPRPPYYFVKSLHQEGFFSFCVAP